MCNYQIYNAALYLRLSKEDEVNGQSESIQNQRDFLTKHVTEQGWNLAGIYIDDGFSGLNFDRPDFKRMLKDIEEKKINLVITKDLSRLGRDYIDTGYYLERYFPSKKVRYIALNDGIDTMADSGSNDISPFKAVINDMYAKDISKKVRTTFKMKQEAGKFIGDFAPYGYIKNPENKNHLLIDEEVAGVVRRIFALYLNGINTATIAEMLHNEGVECPSAYKKRVLPNYNAANIKYFLWSRDVIAGILRNPTYCGSLTQGKSKKVNYKIDKRIMLPRSEWITVEGTHEGLVSAEDFDAAQIILGRKANGYQKRERTRLLNGLLFCKECGGKMTYRRSGKGYNLLCQAYSRFGLRVCYSNSIREDFVEQYVIDNLRTTAKQALSADPCSQFKDLRLQAQDHTGAEIEAVKKELDKARHIVKKTYINSLEGMVDESVFREVSDKYNAEIQRLQRRLANLERSSSSSTKHDYQELVEQFTTLETVDKSMLMKLINKIEISKEKEIFISYNFKNPFDTAI